MTNRLPFMYAALVLLAGSLSSCEIIGDIFQAGMWVGLIVVALVVGVIVWLLRLIGGRRG